MEQKYENGDAKVSRKKLIGEIAGVCVVFLGIGIVYGTLYSRQFNYYDPYYLLDETAGQIRSGNFISYTYVELMKFLFRFLGVKVSAAMAIHFCFRFFSCLLLFFGIKNIFNYTVALVVTPFYALIPFVIEWIMLFDGILLAELVIASLLFLFSLIIAGIKRKRRKEEVPQKEERIKEKRMKKKESEVPTVQEVVGDSKWQEIEESSKPPENPSRFIENPLPVPKRHERTGMDYDYEVPEDKMHYDYEISEDFDIR